MAKQRTEAMTDVKSSAETMQCPSCSETIIAEAKECQFCGHTFAFLTPAVLGWVPVAEYAAATSKSEEEVMSAICAGHIDGELVCGEWLVLRDD